LQHKINQQVNARQPRRRSTPWIWGIALAAATLLITAIGVVRLVGDDLIERRLRPATIRFLEERFNSDVELASLDVRLLPLGIEGRGLVLRLRDRPDVPPLITIRSFAIESSMRELWTRHINRVHVTGLHIVVPPRRGDDMPRLSARDPSARGERAQDVRIHELIADDGLLTISAKRPGKSPREFRLAHLRFEDLHFDEAATFEASLSNPVPEGVIHTVGTFGPWNAAEPSLTMIDGTFRFNADLGTIDGIGGKLDAEGTFKGPLERIDTEGRTNTPNFHLSSGGAVFPLRVHYKAVVDGTSGDTLLDMVEADLGSSHVSASGAIVEIEGVKGRRITLDTKARGGRIEDFVRLTTRVETSPIVGNVDVTARLEIPPGPGEVIDRLDLAGTFDLASARFTADAVQSQVDELSRRGRGRPKDESGDDVVSNMRGRFELRRGTLTLPALTFVVDGAEVRLAGSYGIRSEQLDFRGQLRLQAKMSQTQMGWKSVVLKMFDPLFRKDGAGTVLPITVSGTREAPKFGVDVKKALIP
jgi:hypothetical protein